MAEILKDMDGVIEADVSHETGEARVTMAEKKAFNEAAAREALDKDMYNLTECTQQPAATN